MESHPLTFSHATGLAQIAQQHLGLDDLEQEPKLKAAMLAAYRLGQQDDK